MNALLAVAALAALSFLLASALIVASRKLAVDEDPRLDVVEDMLPGNNCGGCGEPGCRAFAEALLSGGKAPAACTVANSELQQAIADYLGMAVGSATRRVARLACAGGSNVAVHRAYYRGKETCIAAAQVAGGGKACTWGCLGYGDCMQVCTFNAITMNDNHLPVVDEALCTACGDCVDICPKNLFSLQVENQSLWVSCKNEEMGDEILDYCQVACTACGRCALDAPDELITMASNLPVIDYARTKNSQAERNAIERCPTGAIVWVEEGQRVHGKATRPVVRHSERPDINT